VFLDIDYNIYSRLLPLYFSTFDTQKSSDDTDNDTPSLDPADSHRDVPDFLKDRMTQKKGILYIYNEST